MGIQIIYENCIDGLAHGQHENSDNLDSPIAGGHRRD